MADTVIAPDLRDMYERIKRSTPQMGWRFALPIIERVSKAEQERDALKADASWAATPRSELAYLRDAFAKAEQDNVALRAIVPYLQHVPEDIIAVWAKDGKCGECGKQINFSSAYRCYDCGTIHHKECLKTHIKESDPRSYMCARKMDQELVALRAKVAKLEAPISNEEWLDLWNKEMLCGMMGNEAATREGVDALIAARGREGE